MVLGKVGQRKGFGQFFHMAFLAGQLIVFACETEFHVGMFEGIGIRILPRNSAHQRELGAEVFRMTLFAGDRLTLKDVGMISGVRIQLPGNLDVAMEATSCQAFVRMAFLA